MASTPIKVLAVGSALGSIRTLFTKVKAIDAKHGKFEILLCSGDFFGGKEETEELKDLLAGKIDVPMSTYIMQGEHPIPEPVVSKISRTGGEVCNNVFMLGKCGILNTAHGIRIAAFGGSYNPDTYPQPSELTQAEDLDIPYFTSYNARAFLNHPSFSPPKPKAGSLAALKALANAPSTHIDILLTHVWPRSITQGSSVALPSADAVGWGAPPVDEIVKKAKPRYHFAAGSAKFWEREPFPWDGEDAGRVTRFVSLGPFGEVATEAGSKKERWFYAFSITPYSTSGTPPPLPANATVNPFKLDDAPSKRPIEETEESPNFIWGAHGGQQPKRGRGRGRGDAPTRKPPEGYACRACASPDHFFEHCPVRGNTGGHRGRGRGDRGRGRGRGHEPVREIAPDECWFCLSNPNLAKYLIVDIGSECYVTLPKGQLPITHAEDDTHISPVPGGGHVLIVPVSHFPTMSGIPPDLAPPILSELDQYRSALRSFYEAYDCSPVEFEVSRTSAKGGHAHVQIVPVPNALKDEVEEAFVQEGQQNGVEWEVDPEDALQGRDNYFRVTLPSGKQMVHLLRGPGFNLQFGRMVLANFLGIPERVDWKECVQSEDDDREDTTAFKAAFAKFRPDV